MNETAAADQPDYLQAWSLRRHPFAEQIDPEFFYAGNTLAQRLDLLTHLMQFSESIVVVSGPSGSGKTTLLEQFLGHINPQWVVCAVDGNQGDQLAATLAQAIGVSPGEDEQALLARWAAQSEPSQQMLVVIDNAEKLDIPVCRRICELAELPDGDRLRIVLFGTAEITDRINAALEQLGSKHTSQTLEIPRLTEEETAAYLMYRLAVAGYSGESPFTPTEVRAICKSADGRPGHINRLANESLVDHHMRARIKKRAPIQRDNKKNITPLWIGASLFIAVLAGYLGWQRLTPTEPPAGDSGPAEPVLSEQEQPLELPAETVDNVPAAQDQKPPASAIPADTEESAAAQPVATTIPAAPASDVPTGPLATDSEADIQKPDKAEATEPVKTVADNPETVTASGQPRGKDWLLKQPPETFTLQLLGSREPSSILDYIKDNSLDPGSTAFYRGRYRNADWYVLLYGLYNDKAAALAARSTLPDKVQKAKPWPRSLKSVQDSINAAQ